MFQRIEFLPQELLRQKLERAIAAPDPTSIHHLQSLLSASEQESSRLLAELDRSKSQLTHLRTTAEAREEDLEAKVSALTSEIDTLRKRGGGDDGELERLRKEVEVLRSVEFSTETITDGDGSDPLSPDSLAVPLDKLLMRKNKRLASEITEKTVAAAELSSKVTKLENQIVDLARREADKDKLIRRLEEDLLRVDPMRSQTGPNGMMVGPRAVGSSANLSSAGLVQSAGPQSPTPVAGAPGAPAPAASQGDQQASLIRILTAQRDRYRHRNGELEELHRKDLEQLSEYRTALEGLKEDNLKLYEKVRFLQAAGTGAVTTSSTDDWDDMAESGDVESGLGKSGKQSTRIGMVQMGGNDAQATPSRKAYKSAVSSASGSPTHQAASAARTYPSVESKYAPMYEARLDPFSRFSRNEEMRRVQQLPPLDRATLQFTRFFLANRYTRMTFLIYAFVLHLMVTMLIYRWSMIEECKHDHGKDYCVAMLGAEGAGGHGAGGLKMESGKKFEVEDHGPGFVPEAGHAPPKLVRRAAELVADLPRKLPESADLLH